MYTPMDFIRIIDRHDHEKSETEIRDWLENRIRHMLSHESDLLWSILYRMDVDEEKIKSVMNNHQSVPVEKGLTRLVLERQFQRNKIRQHYSASARRPNNDKEDKDR